MVGSLPTAFRQAHATRLQHMHSLAAEGGCWREQANENRAKRDAHKVATRQGSTVDARVVSLSWQQAVGGLAPFQNPARSRVFYSATKNLRGGDANIKCQSLAGKIAMSTDQNHGGMTGAQAKQRSLTCSWTGLESRRASRAMHPPKLALLNTLDNNNLRPNPRGR